MATWICFTSGISMQMNPRINAKSFGIPEQEFFSFGKFCGTDKISGIVIV
jgi:hypothetical protein